MRRQIHLPKIIHRMVGPIETNCYMVINDKNEVAVIDPGDCGDELLQLLHEQNITPSIVLLTHGHFDHIGALQAFFNCPVYLHNLDLPFVTKGSENYNRAFPEQSKITFDFRLFSDGEHIPFGDYGFTVVHTPGHTPGSCMFLYPERILFTGDTLFAGEIGRCDLWGGDIEQMRRTMKKIASIQGDYLVLPGHGEKTTLLKEKGSNPYLVSSNW